MSTIKNFIEKIKSARYGKDVRQSIIDAIEQTYDDAIANGHTDMEVAKARNTYNDLNSRLEADKNETNEKIEEEKMLRQNIDFELQNQITNGLSKISSGTPLIANSLDEMTDTTRIYINTANGHWYCYNGNFFEDCGVYQSTVIADRSINLKQLSNQFSNIFKMCDISSISQYWRSGAYANGGINTNVNCISVKNISLKVGDVIGLVAYDTYEFSVFKGNMLLTEGYLRQDYIITENGNYAINVVKQVRCDISDKVNFISNYFGIKNFKVELKENSVGYEYLSKNLQQYIDNIKTKDIEYSESSDIWGVGYFESETGAYNKVSGYSMSKPIKIYKDSQILTNINGATSVSIICKCDENGNYIENLVSGTDIYNQADISYTVLENCYVRFTYRNIDFSNVYIKITNLPLINYKEHISNIENILNNYSIVENELFNCKYCSEGDSITNRNGKIASSWKANENYTPYSNILIKGYQSYVIDMLNCSLDNFGTEGYTIVRSLPDILSRDYSNYDLVTISFGVNDARTNVILGNLGGYKDTEFNTSTFTGAYRKALNHILEDNPSIKIILMTPIQRHTINNFGIDTPNTNGNTLKDFRDRIIEIASIYSLKVCDCFAESDINQYNLYSKTIDGVHPNDKGYATMGKLLCETIRKY